MAIDIDTLKTLERIEKLLASSTGSAGGRAAPRVPGGRNQQTNNAKDPNQKTYKATGVAFDDLSDKADRLGKSFSGLNKTVQATRSNFVAMNKTMRSANRVVGGVKPIDAAPPPPPRTPRDMLAGMFGGANAPREMRNTVAALGAVSTAGLAVVGVFSQLKGVVLDVVDDFFALQSRGISASSSLAGLYVDAIRAGMSLQDYTEMLDKAGPAVARASSFDEFNNTLRSSSDQLAGLGVFGKQASSLAATLANSATTLGVPQEQLGQAMSSQLGVFEKLRSSTLMTAAGFDELVAELASNQEVQSQLLGLNGAERQARFSELTQIRALGLQMGATKEASKALGDAIIEQRKLTAQQRFQSAGTIRQAGAITGMDAGQTETLARLSRKKNLSAEEAALATQIGGRLQAQIETMMNSGNVQQEFVAEQLQERLNSAGVGRFLQASGNVALTSQSGEVQNRDFAKGASDLVKGTGQLLAFAQGLKENPIASALAGAVGSAAFSVGLGYAIGRVLGKVGGGARGVSAAAEGPGVIKRFVSTTVDTVKGGVGKIFDVISKPFKVGPGTGVIKDIQALWATLRGGWQSLIAGVSNVKVSAFHIADNLKAVGATIMNAFKVVKSWLGMAVNTASEVGGVLGKLGGSFGRLLKFIPAIGNIASFFIDSIGEAFTGNIAAAFNADGGGWLERIGNTVFAAVNGIFGGIFGLVDSAIKFFGGDGLGLENAWDRFATLMRGGFFAALAGIAEAVTFGKENKVSSYFREASDNSFKVLDQLSEDQSATISSIGEKNNKKLDEQAAAAKKSTAAVAETSKAVDTAAGVLTSTKNLTSTLVGTAATIGTPGQTARPSVTPPTVNTPAEPTTNTGPAGAASESTSATVTDTLTAQFATIINLLRENLSAEQAQASFAEAMLRATGRPVFSSTDTMIDRVIKRS
jgi:hypothetical protein